MSTFGAEPQFTITYGPNYANYSFDFSSYSGTGNRIYFRRIGEDQKGVEIDNISYTSACISSSATAITQDISIDLDEEGNATLLPALVDDGSYSDCGNHTLSLDKTIFNCENIGVNTLVFTITDNQGNTSSQSTNVTIEDALAPVADLTTLEELTAQCEITSLTSPTATDNCSSTISVAHNVTLPITESQTITWTYDDGNGNVSSQDQTVVITGIEVETNVDGITITASENNADAYRWLDCDNHTIILFETNRSFTPSENGNFAAIITMGNCVDTSNCIAITTAGFNELKTDKISFYPNPANATLTLKTIKKIKFISIVDIAGRMLKVDVPTSNIIDVSDLPKGIYFLQIKTDTGVSSSKFMKK